MIADGHRFPGEGWCTRQGFRTGGDRREQAIVDPGTKTIMGKDDDVRPLAGRRQPVELDGEILGGGDGDWNAAGFAEVLADFAQGVVALVLVDPDRQGIAL